MRRRRRLDELVVEKDLAPTPERAAALILAGQIHVNGVRTDKPGTRVEVNAEIRLAGAKQYVGRGGEKLLEAVKTFGLKPAGQVCCDVGASTGGFTDVLLQHGAAKVYAIDVGYGELAWKLRNDPRVVVMERTNARYLESLPEEVNLAAIDVSFISLRLILPAVRGWLAPQASIVTLIKPQFEAERKEVPSGGVIRDAAIHHKVLASLLHWCRESDFGLRGLVRSPLKGAEGNVEFLAWFQTGMVGSLELDEAIDSIF